MNFELILFTLQTAMLYFPKQLESKLGFII